LQFSPTDTGNHLLTFEEASAIQEGALVFAKQTIAKESSARKRKTAAGVSAEAEIARSRAELAKRGVGSQA